MPTAYVNLPTTVHYRREAFINGFARLGFIVHTEMPDRAFGPEDAAIVWNMTARSQRTIDKAKAAGAALLVSENGYFGSDHNGHQHYAIALDGHNGSGRWHVGDPDRLKKFNLCFRPMRKFGGTGNVLIAAQRGIGSAKMRSPYKFEDDAAMGVIKRGCNAVIRPHPGRDEPAIPLGVQLADSSAVVVWSSNVATKALIHGVPAYYCAPHIVTAGAAMNYHHDWLKTPTEEERQEAFQRAAWAQWSLAEIESGEAIKTLLDVHQGRLAAHSQGPR